MKEQTEKGALEEFEVYLNGKGTTEDGIERTRRNGWSIPRIHFARMVWMQSRGFWI